jgi:hypothetical protein
LLAADAEGTVRALLRGARVAAGGDPVLALRVAVLRAERDPHLLGAMRSARLRGAAWTRLVAEELLPQPGR